MHYPKKMIGRTNDKTFTGERNMTYDDNKNKQNEDNSVSNPTSSNNVKRHGGRHSKPPFKKQTTHQISKFQPIPKDFIDGVVRDTDFAALLIEDGRKLTASGNKFRFLCFSHEETNPSMSLRDNHCICFSCGWKGNIIDYVKLTRGVNFVEALRIVANRIGRDIPSGSKNRTHTLPDYEKFAVSIERLSFKSAQAREPLNTKPLFAYGVGFIPEDIDKYRNFFDKHSARNLETVGIKKLENGSYIGPNAYIWMLKSSNRPVGFTRFLMHKENNKLISDGEHVNGYFSDKSGVAVGRAAMMAWSTKKRINVCDDPVMALNIHVRAKDMGPGAYMPMPESRSIEDSVFNEVMRHNEVRFISESDIVRATFALRSLRKIKDGQILYIAVKRDNKSANVYMSDFLTEWIATSPNGVEHGEGFLRALEWNKAESTCYKKLLAHQFQKAIDLRKERGEPVTKKSPDSEHDR